MTDRDPGLQFLGPGLDHGPLRRVPGLQGAALLFWVGVLVLF